MAQVCGDKLEHLYDKLKQNKASNRYPLHMPGHKRNMAGFPMEAFYEIDITEIDGFDNLHAPEGILKEIMDRASSLYGAETYLLVNGSTGGILSAISAAARRGDCVLMARNCHRSAYHALYLNGCNARYIYPSFLETYGICGGISPERMERMLAAYPDIRAVFLTSPTYDGVVSDVETIVETAHARHIPVIVDEAHGAHFLMDNRFPRSAVDCGADIVIHSIHKTLPSLTQTALLHVQGSLIDRGRLRRFLKIYQTSSPSYVLMAGIEQCISILETEKKALSDRFFLLNDRFEKKVRQLKHLKVFPAGSDGYGRRDRCRNEIGWEKEVFDFDPGKKIISVRGTDLTGQALYDLFLNQYKLQMEMAGQDYATAIMTVMDTEEGFERLADALAKIDAGLRAAPEEPCAETEKPSRQACCIETAMEAERRDVWLEDCTGEISSEFIYIYPPGVPLIAPGEQFSEAVKEQLMRYRKSGLTIEGMKERNRKVSVLKDKIFERKDEIF
ncbi:MAG: PLP-dependent transferase [Lachnospiraceae bacterium]|nr:PLP-dependent transferase [Lachnospiraceae bacterium]